MARRARCCAASIRSVIFTSTALQLISMNLAGSYSLGTDIDFTGAVAANLQRLL